MRPVARLLRVHSHFRTRWYKICELTSALKKNAAMIAERTSVKPDELTAAEDTVNRLGKAVGLREPFME